MNWYLIRDIIPGQRNFLVEGCSAYLRAGQTIVVCLGKFQTYRQALSAAKRQYANIS